MSKRPDYHLQLKLDAVVLVCQCGIQVYVPTRCEIVGLVECPSCKADIESVRVIQSLDERASTLPWCVRDEYDPD